MSTSSQEPRGPGLSSTLVSDFRAILNSLEQEKAAGKGGPAERPASSVASRASGESGPSAAAKAPVASGPMPPRRRTAPDHPAPLPYPDVRSRIAALGEVSDMFAAPSAPASARTVAPAPRAVRGPADVASAPPAIEPGKPLEARPAPVPPPAPAAAEARRRGFGSTRDGEMAVRRRRSSSSDVITWKRLGMLAICMALAGGGAVALQSVVGREEAEVAPEAIGNAAIASVAPSAPLAVAATAAPAPEGTSHQVAAVDEVPAFAAVPDVAAIVADVPQPVLRNAEPVFEPAPSPQVPVNATAFVSPDAGGDNTSKPVELPKQAPLPPPAPSRMAAAAAPARADVARADVEAASDEAPADEVQTPSAFGGDPVGTVTIRSSVTMRAQPKRGGAAIGNLQRGEKVDLVACDGWCEVVADGKRGFIYKSFVDIRSIQQADAAPQ